MPKGLPFRLRDVLAKLREDLRTRRGAHPRTTAALDQLHEAIEAEFGPQRGQATDRANIMSMRVVRLRQRACRAEKKVAQLQDQVASITAAKVAGGRLSDECFVRVFLASPVVTGRALSQAFRDILGPEGAVVSRPSMEGIRDAWVEIYKPMVLKTCAEMVAEGLEAARQEGRAFAPVIFLHCQDEFDARLRSGDPRDGPKMPRRGRASKVQQHVLRLVVGHRERDIPSELEALGDKTAGTLATSFERVLRRLVELLPLSTQSASSIAASSSVEPPRRRLRTATGPDIWVVHILVGDGINTNEAAAKLLWSCVASVPLGRGVRYFLILVKCATHQVALSAKAAVEGVPTKIAGGELHKSLVGTAVRLYKYILCDYFEEVCSAVHVWVDRTLEVLPAASCGADPNCQQQTVALRELYTEHVLPDGMLALFNNGLQRMTHVLAVGRVPANERPRLVNEFTQWHVQHLARVDACPCPSRFFTFRGATDRMLAMHLVGFPINALSLPATVAAAREESRKRVLRVLSFFRHAEAAQCLRRTALCFQVTGGVEALVTASRKTTEPPIAVRLLRGAADEVVAHRVSRILGAMPLDPTLDLAAATGAVLGTGADVLIRMEQFKDYPTRIVRLSRKWCPERVDESCNFFLWASPEELDVGVGVPLQRLAWEGRSEMEAVRWLLSKSVQELIDDIAEQLFFTSIEVERRHAEVKNWNPARKVAHIATVSRNAIILRFARWRAVQTKLLERAAAELNKAKRTSWTSLAWKEASVAGRPVGKRFTAARDDACLQAPLSRAEAACLGSIPCANPGPVAIMDLRRRLKDDVTAAQQRYDEILATLHVPATRQQWLHWVRTNNVEFQQARKDAPVARRQLNIRVRARPDLPAPAPRMQPVLARPASEAAWELNLRRRSGWFGVRTAQRKVFFFLTTLRGRSYCAVLASYPVVGGDGRKGFEFNQDFDLQMRLKPLHQLAEDLGAEVVAETLEFKVAGRPSDSWVESGQEGRGGVYVEPTSYCRVVAELPASRRRTEETQEGEDDFRSDGDLKCASDLSDDGGVLDTDVESCGGAFEEESGSEGGEPAVDAAVGEVPSKPSKKTHPKHLWENEYFYITDNTAANDGTVKMLMFDAWSRADPPLGMGSKPQRSKTYTCSHFGWTRDLPECAFLLLRGWMLWRFAQGGFAEAERGRQRQYLEETAALMRDIRAQGRADFLLGSAKANSLLKSFVPEMVLALQKGV